MRYKKWKAEVFTIPNILSCIRLLLIPVYISLYLNAREPEQFHIAGMILAISCLTDAADGFIARRFHMVSTLGKILDPLADKITQFALIFCLALKYPALRPLVYLFAVKEFLQLALGIHYLQQGKMLRGALFAGKVCTAVLFISLTLLVVFPNTNTHIIKAIALTDSVFLCSALCGYFFAYLGKNKKVFDIDAQ